MEKSGDKTKWSYVFKVISFLVGAGLVIVGVFDLLGFSISDPITLVLPIYYILFGMLIIAAEVPVNFILVRFLFIRNLFGRGLFYIIIGFLCLRNQIYQYIMGGFLLFVGLCYMVMFFACRSRTDITNP